MSNEQFKVLTGIDLDLEFKDQPEIEPDPRMIGLGSKETRLCNIL